MAIVELLTLVSSTTNSYSTTNCIYKDLFIKQQIKKQNSRTSI